MGRKRECQNWLVGHSSDMPSAGQLRPSCSWLAGLQSKGRKLESDLGGLRLSWVPRESVLVLVLSSSARAGVDTVPASSLSSLLGFPVTCISLCSILTFYGPQLPSSDPPDNVRILP